MKISQIDNLSGEEFEFFLFSEYEKQGYSPKHTGQSGDFGVDLIIYKNKKKIIVQVKRYTKNVGVEAVQQVYSALTFYKGHKAIVITNSHFTAAAKILSNECNVELWDREKICKHFDLKND